MNSRQFFSEIDFTAVLPTYNGADRIPQVLEKLRDQMTPDSLHWEIVVVDNNSQDDTAAVVKQFQRSWREDVPLRYVFEPKQGLAYARQCGIEQAKGALVGFLDDDNWPQDNWVSEAFKFGREYPQAGAYSGSIKGVFETPPDETVKPLLRFLAVRDFGDAPRKFQVSRIELPPGAGLTVRKAAWLDCIPPTLVNITRSGDDYEISLRMAKQGWEIWYNPKMEIGHFIPASRLKRDYLLKLTHLYGLCTCKLLMIETPLWQQPFILFRSFLGSLKRILIHYIQHRSRRSTSLESECQLAFHIGNLKSPFHYLGTRLRHRV